MLRRFGQPQDDNIRKIAVYGKGGIGKSTTSSNVSAALSHMGQKVFQVGCDPKHDSIVTLCGGGLKPTILSLTQELDRQDRSGKITQETIASRLFVGYNGILCAESGGPRPATGCAGKGVDLALTYLFDHKVPQRYGITFMLFDVLGDVVCAGFSKPIRSGYAKEMYIVGNGETLGLYQLNNLAAAAARMKQSGVDIGVGGIINNMRGVPHEEELADEFAKLIEVPVIGHVPRSRTVQMAENQGKTVIEAFPDSEQAEVYRQLAKNILNNTQRYVPKPTPLAEIKRLVREVKGNVEGAAQAKAS